MKPRTPLPEEEEFLALLLEYSDLTNVHSFRGADLSRQQLQGLFLGTKVGLTVGQIAAALRRNEPEVLVAYFNNLASEDLSRALHQSFDPVRAAQDNWPPGSSLRKLAKRVVSSSTYTFVIEPTLSDLADEHAFALTETPWRARYVRLRGYWSFWAAVAAHLVVALGRRVAKFWAHL